MLTCIDSRIEPLAMLGLAPGDAKILRNAGARVTDDVLRSLVLAVNLLGVNRVCVVQHTGCRLTGASNEDAAGDARRDVRAPTRGTGTSFRSTTSTASLRGGHRADPGLPVASVRPRRRRLRLRRRHGISWSRSSS